MSKNNFILYKDFKPTLKLLNDEQAGKWIKAVFDYVDGRNEPDFTDDGMLQLAFSITKTQLERDLVKYKNIVERNKKNGLKGGRPSNKEKETQTDKLKPKKPSGILGNPNKPKKADSVSDSVSDRDSDKKDIKKTSKKFIKPTLQDLQNYCTEKSYNIDCQNFIDYYESNGWKVGRNPMKDWKATVRTWNNRNKKDTTPTETAKSREIKDNLFGGTKYAN